MWCKLYLSNLCTSFFIMLPWKDFLFHMCHLLQYLIQFILYFNIGSHVFSENTHWLSVTFLNDSRLVLSLPFMFSGYILLILATFTFTVCSVQKASSAAQPITCTHQMRLVRTMKAYGYMQGPTAGSPWARACAR